MFHCESCGSTDRFWHSTACEIYDTCGTMRRQRRPVSSTQAPLIKEADPELERLLDEEEHIEWSAKVNPRLIYTVGQLKHFLGPFSDDTSLQTALIPGIKIDLTHGSKIVLDRVPTATEFIENKSYWTNRMANL